MDTQKIHYWSGGICTGTGELGVIYRMQAYLQKGVDIALLSPLLKNEKQIRHGEVGDSEQIDNTLLIVSTYTESGPRLYIIESDSIATVAPGEVLFFFPLDYDFFSVSAEAVKDLDSSIKSASVFDSPLAWIKFYADKLSNIYALQSANNPTISKSFHVHFQSGDFSLTSFVPNASRVRLHA